MRSFIALLCGALLATTAWAEESRFITYQQGLLAASKTAVHQQQPAVMPAYEELVERADAALEEPLYSVTDKSQLPVSGNPHDYFSFAPYWWPNPDTENGLPYVQRDGEYNMDTKSNATDKQRMIDFAKDVHALGLAYYFTGNQAYAEKAARQVVNWFVEPDTRMAPHMRYAQAIPGRVDGRGIGIIDSRLLILVMDAIELIRPADVLSKEEYGAIQAWYEEFLDWLLTSDNGIEEGTAANNHGTWYDAQVVAFALFTERLNTARAQLNTARRRIANQFDPAGKQPEELDRTRPWHYLNFNLEAYTKLGRYGEKLDEPLWEHQAGERSLQNGFRFAAGYAANGEQWPYEELKAFDNSKALPNLLAAAHAYEQPDFFRIARQLARQAPESLSLLLYPLAPVH